MYCPFCNVVDTKVIDSRLSDDGTRVRRRRECESCGERFTTYEIAEVQFPQIIKRDGTRAVFDEEKLRHGMQKALEKRPVSAEQLDQAVQAIVQKLRSNGDREVSSLFLGELVMEQLRQLDKVSYVRFASVYRSFEDVDAFHHEIERLKEHE